jgi:hypothetical protein
LHTRALLCDRMTVEKFQLQYGLVQSGANFRQNQCSAAALRGTRFAVGLIRVEDTAILAGSQNEHFFKRIVTCEKIAGI